MATSAGRLTICNMALGFIGTRTIASPNERTPEAIQCDLYWDRARRSALRDHPWSFARRRASLAEVAELPEVYAGTWEHIYVLPSACLKVHRVERMGGHAGEPETFEIVNVDGYLNVLSNAPDAVCDYTFDCEDVSLWDELFVMSMARKLAALVAIPLLKNNQSKLQELETLYRESIPVAEGHDASERRERARMDSWLACRGVEGGDGWPA